jgi:hypothetical protein
VPRTFCSTFANLEKALDILYSVDYYLIINNLTAKEKPMTDTLETYTDENLREIEAVEDYE